MTEASVNQVPENKPSDKELNFRKLEARYQQQLDLTEKRAQEAERALQESRQRPSDDDDDSEPYVDHKKLEKKLAKFEEKSQKQNMSEIQKAVQVAIQEERKTNWVKNNSDFYNVLEQHAEKLAKADPELAESILAMPESFERQKLVYKNIKALGLDRPEVKQPSIQEKIDANKRSPYYQPSGVGTAPYASSGDFSASGQKQAYEKMQQLKNALRI